MGEWMDTMDGNKYLFEKRVGGGGYDLVSIS